MKAEARSVLVYFSRASDRGANGHARSDGYLPDQRHPLRKSLLYTRPLGTLYPGDKRPRPDCRGGVGRPDGRWLPPGVRGGGRVPEAHHVRAGHGHPRQPRLAQRRLHPLRAFVRGTVLGHGLRECRHGRRRFLRARPRRRAGRARALRVYPRDLRRGRRQAQDLRHPPPPDPHTRHGTGAQHHLRRGRRARAAGRYGSRPGPLRPQARAVLLAARRHVYRQRRHRLDHAPQGQHAPLLQHHRDRGRQGEGLPQVSVQGQGADRKLRRGDPPVPALRGGPERRQPSDPGRWARGN